DYYCQSYDTSLSDWLF
nr:immunoglobulin light chain junction region [Macaca mulatta]MOV94856.1 immunoglobulin light chain junction region [Macaca mulatta]MOV95115.1 immunoglobulin light chain junction region [Macaca mulatta]MOV95853.1 immunoglobulin light chain junction region [Macaca mulatta]MOV96000.1 immunoglobulin light chain junction region [Macaca mulatta]